MLQKRWVVAAVAQNLPPAQAAQNLAVAVVQNHPLGQAPHNLVAVPQAAAQAARVAEIKMQAIVAIKTRIRASPAQITQRITRNKIPKKRRTNKMILHLPQKNRRQKIAHLLFTAHRLKV